MKMVSILRPAQCTLLKYGKTFVRIAASNFSCSQVYSKEKIATNIEYYYEDKNSYEMYAVNGGYVKEAALEAARISVVRKTKNKNVYKTPAIVPVTKKAQGSRMGKGKGKVAYYAAIVSPGTILLGFEAENETIAREAFKQATYKLPFKTHFRVRPKQEPIILSASQLSDIMSGKEYVKDYTAFEENDNLVLEKMFGEETSEQC